jgi:hypothetical protein
VGFAINLDDDVKIYDMGGIILIEPRQEGVWLWDVHGEWWEERLRGFFVDGSAVEQDRVRLWVYPEELWKRM